MVRLLRAGLWRRRAPGLSRPCRGSLSSGGVVGGWLVVVGLERICDKTECYQQPSGSVSLELRRLCVFPLRVFLFAGNVPA